MRFPLGMENNYEGRSLAWSLEHPGCFSYGVDSDEALSASLQAVEDYVEWIAHHNNGQCWIEVPTIEPYIAENWDVYTIDDEYQLSETGYQVNAWFLNDWKRLTAQEIERGKSLLNWSRKDLLLTVSELSTDSLEVSFPGERWSIAGILKHVGGAEWWYLDRLGLSLPSHSLAEEPFQRLAAVRARLMEFLPNLVDVQQVIGVDGEFWSPRKLLRRALWHERDHNKHIQLLKSNL